MGALSRVGAALIAVLALAATHRGAAAAPSVLFIGNSFTFGAGSAAQFYRADTVTDLNQQGKGGMPALFRSFANQAGLDFDVALETQPGSGLEFHLEHKRAEIGSRAWDTVVMHGQSTLDFAKPRDPAKLIETSAQMATLLRGRNPKVAIYLLATWSRADQTYPAGGAWAGQPIDAMARDVRAAYDQAAERIGAKGILPVGEAWTRAIQAGVADANPYDGIDAGKIDLWAADHYHASVAGSYLEALVVFGTLTGRDPRALGEFECSAYELGLSRAQATALQQVAFDQLLAVKTAMAPGTSDRKAAGRCAAPPAPAR
jgi:hypothetical protein